METKTCLNCPNLRGCRLIEDGRGRVSADKVALPPHSTDCPEWGPAPVGESEVALRILLLKKFGLSAVQAVHRLATQNLEDEEEDVADEHVDLGSLLFEGITKSERKQQLTYLTDEEGNVVVDEGGHKELRRTLLVRKYAVQELNLPPEQAQFWSSRELVKAVIEKEEELGYFKSKSKKKRAKEAAQQPTQEKKMPVVSSKSKVVVRKGGSVAKGAVPSKVAAQSKTAQPVTSKKKKAVASKKVASKKGAAPKEEHEAPEEERAAVAGADMDTLRREMEERDNALRQYVKAQFDGLINVMEANLNAVRQDMIQQHTILHDVGMYRTQLNATLVPVVDEEGNHLVGDDGDPMYSRYEVEDPEDGLLQSQGKDITYYEAGDGVEGEE